MTRMTTTLSTKGQVILPKTIRDQRRWKAGTRLTIEDTAEGVLLKPTPAFPSTAPGAAFGILRYKGKPKTIKDMNAAIEAEVKWRHARGRY